MPGATTKITNRERAAVLMNAAGILDDWTEIFLIADERPREEIEKQKYLIQYVSRWKNSDKIKKCLAENSKIFADRDAETRAQARQEERRKIQEENETRQQAGDSNRDTSQAGRPVAKDIDFYDPANQRKQINRIIQESGDDPRTQLDAIKAIQQTQRDDRQAARDQKQVKTYLPQRCAACPLMMRARAKTTK